MFIVVVEHRVDATGNLEKLVTCEACCAKYVYKASCTAEGHGATLYGLDNDGASKRAAANAELELKKALKSKVEIRPCPACGHFQSDMVREARWSRHRWLSSHVAIVLLMIFAIVGVIAYCMSNPLNGRPIYSAKTWMINMALIGCAIMTIPFVRYLLIRKYDPNAESEEDRRKRGVYYLPGIPVSTQRRENA